MSQALDIPYLNREQLEKYRAKFGLKTRTDVERYFHRLGVVQEGIILPQPRPDQAAAFLDGIDDVERRFAVKRVRSTGETVGFGYEDFISDDTPAAHILIAPNGKPYVEWGNHGENLSHIHTGRTLWGDAYFHRRNQQAEWDEIDNYTEAKNRLFEMLEADPINEQVRLATERFKHNVFPGDYHWTVSQRMAPNDVRRSVGWHEMGHVLHLAERDAAGDSIGRKIDRFLEFQDPIGSGWDYLVSQYAGTLDVEYVAESFVLYMMGEDHHGRIHPDLLEIFKEYDNTVQ